MSRDPQYEREMAILRLLTTLGVVLANALTLFRDRAKLRTTLRRARRTVTRRLARSRPSPPRPVTPNGDEARQSRQRKE